ncbi:EAL domain-containing protein [Acuticoccus sp. I52.16.1]|uniref:EAL domain-containing response regulator n=1 Tax=Acuticoccus sp. I52.16.1 TaxID=2928472 RepID=UPI001FD2CA14|nr:EAL domain-containing response regulator [Acuticoccus sp. I52.16.1]UOM37335.1 EAL domain-containing response regulator [Acuticoccus sp. I52.16.1]
MTAQRVAILDDEADIRTLTSMILSEAGLVTSVWANGLELIEHLKTSPVDIVVCDLLMPDCDGVEFFAKLSQLEERPALILVSGQDARTRHSARNLAREFGVEVLGEFGKPTEFSLLEACILEHVAQKADTQSSSNHDVEDALRQGELRAHYQPIFAVSEFPDSGRRRVSLSSVEALVRWEHPTAGLLTPGDFLPQISSSETWERLTYEMLGLVCGQAAAWNALGFAPRVAINIPPLLLADRDLPRRIDDVLQGHGIEPAQIVLELTEEEEFSSILDDKAVLMRLKMRGYSISVDDFGVGYSSLKRLQGGLFDQIKIDRSFVTRVDQDAEARNILTSTVGLARSLGMSVCAEGVETYEVMCQAIECGCSHLQGFGLCRPVKAELLEMQYAPDPGDAASADPARPAYCMEYQQ